MFQTTNAAMRVASQRRNLRFIVTAPWGRHTAEQQLVVKYTGLVSKKLGEKLTFFDQVIRFDKLADFVRPYNNDRAFVVKEKS